MKVSLELNEMPRKDMEDEKYNFTPSQTQLQNQVCGQFYNPSALPERIHPPVSIGYEDGRLQ